METETLQFRQCLRAKTVAAIGEARRAGNPHTFQFGFDLFQLLGQPSRVRGLRKIRVSPAVIADLEAHLMYFRDVFPGHEVFGVLHPELGDEERCAEAEFLEERCDESPLRLDGVVEGQHYEPFLAWSLLRQRGRRAKGDDKRYQDQQRWFVHSHLLRTLGGLRDLDQGSPRAAAVIDRIGDGLDLAASAKVGTAYAGSGWPSNWSPKCRYCQRKYCRYPLSRPGTVSVLEWPPAPGLDRWMCVHPRSRSGVSVRAPS